MYKGLLFITIVLLLAGCDKVKPDIPSTLTGAQVINSPGSSIRLFNFYGTVLDVKVNNTPLTAFSTNPNAQGNQIGLALFPTNGWTSDADGSPVTLPTSLEDKNASMQIIIKPRLVLLTPGIPNANNFYIDTTIVDDPLNPKDYYLLRGGQLKVIPRNSLAPSNPQNFKIRVFNLGAIPDTMNLGGKVTMTYADGTPVSTTLSGVDTGKASDYVELPFGAYQFKLYIANPDGSPNYNKQLSELPSYPNIAGGIGGPQTDLTTNVTAYMPGGTYSLVVTPNVFGYDINDFYSFYIINGYRVLTEQAPPTNLDWARIQGVNALSSTSGVSFYTDGQAMGTNIVYGKAGDYSIVSKGTHTITAEDGSGKVLCQGSFPFSSSDNITAWAWDSAGQPAITFTNTDFTSTIYEATAPGVVNDGTSGATNIIKFTYDMQLRFMNLSDVPYITFTQDGNLLSGGGSYNQLQADTSSYQETSINLQPGVPVSYNPFVVETSPLGLNLNLFGGPALYGYPFINGYGGNVGWAGNGPTPLLVYASEPAMAGSSPQIPGTILPGMPALQATSFAAGSLIYAGGAPNAENGFYTVALIGNISGATGNPGSGQIIVIKHNK